MEALMQDFPLTLHHILWRAERLFARKEIVTKTADGVRRYTYGDFVARVFAENADEACRKAAADVTLAPHQHLTAEPAAPADELEQEMNRTSRA